MAAADAVFNTYELLEHIITYLRPVDVAKTKRVSKVWAKIIQESRHIHDLRIPTPRRKLDELNLNQHFISSKSFACSYDLGCHFKLTPALEGILSNSYPWSSVYEDSRGRRHYEAWMQLPNTTDGLKDEVLDAFVTTPPCQAIHLFLTTRHPRYQIPDCVVYVRDGVRLHDLMAAAEGMEVSEVLYGIKSSVRKLRFSAYLRWYYKANWS